MAAPTLQQAIDQAGSPIKLLWKPDAKAWTVPVIAPEYAGWREEQDASNKTVAFSDLSHHMFDLFVEGPDATRLLQHTGANNFENFVVGQAKQFVPVTPAGHLITDGILLREDEQRYTLSGVPAAQHWVAWQAEQGGYDVQTSIDPDSTFRKGDPKVFRYQVQGPHALELTEKVFGGPLPKTKFFHSTPVAIGGRQFRAFRHGMSGMPGYEFIGDWADAAAVKEALWAAGEELGMLHVGGLAYYTNGIASGWIPTPTPGIYTAPELADYRRHLSLFSYEGQKPLHGSFFSENIADYYVSPFELGYGKSIAFNHDFIGREALEAAASQSLRRKVTLVLDADQVRQAFGDRNYVLTYARYRVEAGSKLAGMTFYNGYIDPLGTVLCLALVDPAMAEPGTEVEVVWGEHPGPGHDPDGDFGFTRFKARVAPAPYSDHARSDYRKD
jgi:vanillate/3-O-methylgallate O-demethylase